MREENLRYLACPRCSGALRIEPAARSEGGHVSEGHLTCSQCSAGYPIIRSIPRFVGSDNYAASFGLEWTLHARTQHDEHSGVSMSEQRFFQETRWPRRLDGETILEVGSGSGRFTTHAASTGAIVVSIDYSQAVEANYAANGSLGNVVIAQGDIFELPVPRAFFDRVCCLGVLQHTPAPQRAFAALVEHTRPGGTVVADVYKRTIASHLLQTKYWVRPLTKRIPPARLYRVVRRYIDLVWPLASQIRRIPRVGPMLNWRLLVADYSREGIPETALKEWAYLDTFDMLSPRYDTPQTLATVERWLLDARLENAEAKYGYNGIELRGDRPRD